MRTILINLLACKVVTFACVLVCILNVQAEGNSRTIIGIGVSIDSLPGQCSVTRVLPGSPADRCGMRAGDILLGIGPTGHLVDMRSLAAMDVQGIRALLNGTAGSEVAVRFERRSGTDSGSIDIAVVKRVKIELVDQANGIVSESALPEIPNPTLDRLPAEGVREVSWENWVNLTNGMPKSAVIRALGSPLRTESKSDPGIDRWIYGRLYEVKSVCRPTEVSVFFKNGLVLERSIEPLRGPTLGSNRIMARRQQEP